MLKIIDHISVSKMAAATRLLCNTNLVVHGVNEVVVEAVHPGAVLGRRAQLAESGSLPQVPDV